MGKVIYLFVIGILLLNAICSVANEVYLEGIFQIKPFIQLNLLYILFGILIQWKSAARILKKKAIKPTMLLIPVLMLFILIDIPIPILAGIFNLNHHLLGLFIAPLTNNETHSIIGMFSGSLFIKSIDP